MALFKGFLKIAHNAPPLRDTQSAQTRQQCQQPQQTLCVGRIADLTERDIHEPIMYTTHVPIRRVYDTSQRVRTH